VDFIICISCKEEVERDFEEFQKTDEYKFECEFNKWSEKEMKKI